MPLQWMHFVYVLSSQSTFVRGKVGGIRVIVSTTKMLCIGLYMYVKYISSVHEIYLHGTF